MATTIQDLIRDDIITALDESLNIHLAEKDVLIAEMMEGLKMCIDNMPQSYAQRFAACALSKAEALCTPKP